MTDLQKPSPQGGSTTGWGEGRGTCPSGPFIIGKGSMAPGHYLMLCVSSPVYAAGKAATSGVPSIYAPSTYAYLSPAKTPPPATMIPMGTVYNGYSGDFDKNSSGEVWGSQEQLGEG